MGTKKRFSYFSTKTYVVGTQKNCLIETVDGSFECTKQMLKLRGKKIFTILCTQTIVYLDLCVFCFLLAHIVCSGFMLSVVLCVLCSLPGKLLWFIYEPGHEIPNNVVCATSKSSDQHAHMRSLIRAFACRLNILRVLSY